MKVSKEKSEQRKEARARTGLTPRWRSGSWSRLMIENTLDLITVMSNEGKVVYQTPSVERVLGYRPRELGGRNFLDFFHPDDHDKILAALEDDGAQPDRVRSVEVRCLHKDGSWRILEAVGKRVGGQRPGRMGFVVNSRDITQRKLTEDRLRRFQDMLTASKELMAFVDDRYVYQAVNDTYLAYHEKERAEIVGRSVAEVLGAEVFANLLKANLDRALSGEQVRCTNWFTFGSIGKRYMETMYYPSFTEDISITGVVVKICDITEHHQTARSLQLFRSLIEKLDDAIFIIDAERGQILDVNEKACFSTGYDRDELQGMGISSLLNLPEGFFWRDQVARVRGSGAEVREFPQRRKNGTVFPAEISLKFVAQEDCTYIVAVARDITGRKQGEKNLLRYQEQLRKLASKLSRAEEQERRRIAVGLHDQIGQPLSVIKMKLGRMQQENGQNGAAFSEIREFLDRAIQETRSLTFELSPPILHELGLKAALEWLGEQFAGLHGLHCHLVDGDGEAKQVSGELQMVLFRSIRELLANIVKHARTSQAWITMRKEKDRLRIEVRDRGAGFLADEAMATRDGFGLFNIRERLSHFGGDLAIDSAPGRGTAVILYVPLTGY